LLKAELHELRQLSPENNRDQEEEASEAKISRGSESSARYVDSTSLASSFARGRPTAGTEHGALQGCALLEFSVFAPNLFFVWDCDATKAGCGGWLKPTRAASRAWRIAGTGSPLDGGRLNDFGRPSKHWT
jgi:hypothetical protein